MINNLGGRLLALLTIRTNAMSAQSPCPLPSSSDTLNADAVSSQIMDEPSRNLQPLLDAIDAAEGTASKTHCQGHTQKELELFCVKCDALICMECKLSDHLHHESQFLSDKTIQAAEQLAEDKRWLETVIEDLIKILKENKTDQEELKLKKAVVEREVRRRHSLIVSTVDKFQEEALAGLEIACAEQLSALSGSIEDLEQNLDYMQKLQQRLKLAAKDSNQEIFATSKELKSARTRAEVALMTYLPLNLFSKVRRPVHHATVSQTVQGMFDSLKTFIGHTQMLTLKAIQPEVKVEEQFRCSEDDDAVPFCICPVDNGTILVSFEPDFNQHKLPAKRFSEKGNLIRTLKSVRNGSEPLGRISIKERRGKEKIMFCIHEDGSPSAYAKSRCKRLYKLEHYQGKSYIGITQVMCETPELRTCQTDQFSIACGFHRAFDVDRDENVFIVVAELAEDPQSQHQAGLTYNTPLRDSRRDVLLFKRHHVNAMDIYNSPLTPYQPADVCFFQLEGQEVLLIADECNDVIHVVIVHNDRMTFCRFLAPGTPLLLQPTALNTDRRGRLWVGCRGGRLITFEPLSNS